MTAESDATSAGTIVIPHRAGAGTRSPRSTEVQQATQLLAVEGQIRRAQSREELAAILANGLRQVLRAKQIFVFERTQLETLQATAATQLAKIDRTSPLIADLEHVASRCAKHTNPTCYRLSLSDAGIPGPSPLTTYPFSEAMWLPLRTPQSHCIGGALLLSTTPWSDSDLILADRIASAASQATHWLLAQPRRLSINSSTRWRTRAGIAAAVAAMGLIPITSSTLAPCEIVPREAFVVAAPMDGVIDTVAPLPNANVTAGDVIVTLAAVTLEGRLSVAEREVDVAASRVKKAMALAIADTRGRQELALARAELAVKVAERTQALEMLQRSRVKAGANGIALYADRRELLGKPVVTGEKLLEIADPERVEVRIDVNVADAVFLNRRERTKIYLDNQPLTPISAHLVRSDY